MCSVQCASIVMCMNGSKGYHMHVNIMMVHVNSMM